MSDNAPNFDAVARRDFRFGRQPFGWNPSGGGGGGDQFIPTPDAPGFSGGVLVPPFPEQTIPPSGTYFVAQGTLDNITAGSGQVVLGSFQVPDNSVAVIRNVVITGAPWTLTSVVRWAILLDGVPAPGWSFARIPRVPAAAAVREFTPELVTIRVGAGALIEVVAQVDAADLGNYQLEGEARGWIYPQETFDRFRDAWG